LFLRQGFRWFRYTIKLHFVAQTSHLSAKSQFFLPSGTCCLQSSARQQWCNPFGDRPRGNCYFPTIKIAHLLFESPRQKMNTEDCGSHPVERTHHSQVECNVRKVMINQPGQGKGAQCTCGRLSKLQTPGLFARTRFYP